MIEIGNNTLSLDKFQAWDTMRQSLCFYKLGLTLKEHMMAMSKLHSQVRKHRQDFIHSSGIVSHSKNISKCPIFSCVFWLSLKPSQFVFHLSFISWATLPHFPPLAPWVQSISKGYLPFLSLPGLVQHQRRVQKSQASCSSNINATGTWEIKLWIENFPNHTELGKTFHHRSSVVLAADIQYLSAQHTSKGVLWQSFEQWLWLTACWSVKDDDSHAKTEHLYSSVSAPCFKIQQC